MIIRQAGEADRHMIEDLLTAVQMEGTVEASAYLVAEIDGRVVGAGRLEWAGGETYLRSIVVNPACQGVGIGRALVERLIAGENRVKLVSRGTAISFYRRLGFQPIDWTAIDPTYQQECETCLERVHCRPQPLARVWPERAPA